jgi:starch synthase
MYSQIYGTPPVARRVGGLVDSIVPFPTDGATGFLFDAPTAEALYGAVRQAVELFRHAPHAYRRMQERGMAQDFSWDGAGVVYEQAYLRALARARAAAAPGLALDVSRASG